MYGERISYYKTIKYLGILFDLNLSFIFHLNEVQEKVFKLNEKLRRITKATWDLKPQVVKEIYKTVVEKLIQYGSEIWYKDIAKINNKLIQIQRQTLLGITKTYRTVSNEAIQVLSGCPPLDLKIRIENDMVKQIRKNKLNKIIDEKISFEYEKRIQPWKSLNIDWNYYMEEMKGMMIFTDGFEMDERVGSAFVVFYNEIELDYRKFRLNESSTVFMAEVIAIQQAIQYVGQMT
ncbi:Retrovirus-related Pol polyprotein from type-1 retrotransposable element R1 4 [Araneus ventricosus]|uniref:Retrovirus-related Pol polyprotein from type-1 retrotransposable element R1 4 n=1 Tax=Araneus ventricosus TaxID=182803 RepID=A0A4Y2RBJ9_ARAVE|nr:Retrovirus-related Pol polyprotein from type-1 retrotransposable element R1 4 [Araneus ventricosus]